MPAVFGVLIRLRQACTHIRLLPAEMQLAQPSSEKGSGKAKGNTEDSEGSQDSTGGSNAEGDQDPNAEDNGDYTKGRAEDPEGNQGRAKGKQVPQSLATRLDGIQAKRGQSTKTKRVLRIIKVC